MAPVGDLCRTVPAPDAVSPRAIFQSGFDKKHMNADKDTQGKLDGIVLGCSSPCRSSAFGIGGHAFNLYFITKCSIPPDAVAESNFTRTELSSAPV